jgi:ATP-dependent DNA helicase RecG
MTIERLLILLQGKEGQHLEFKEARFALPAGLFETICAMLNGEGGDILLGVNDFGTITGIEAEQVDKMIKDLVSLSNNPTKITPTFILFPRKHQIDGKWLVHIQIPASSQVHKASKVIYDRSSDGDFRITETTNRGNFQPKKNPLH